MRIRFGSCVNKVDMLHRRPKIFGYRYRIFNLIICKLIKSFEIYTITDPDTNELVQNMVTGKTLYGQNLNEIEIKWVWDR